MLGVMRAYRAFVEPRLPRKVGVYNGVAVRDVPLLQSRDHWPEHKDVLCEAVRAAVSPGDEVVVIGAGRGVVATIAGRQGGDVTAFDPAREMVDLCSATAELNGVDVDVRHAAVGPVIDAYGSTTGAGMVPPAVLEADVAVLDCEGAELVVLPDLDAETVIVETHPRFGAETSAVLDRLEGGEVVGEDAIDGEVVVA